MYLIIAILTSFIITFILLPIIIKVSTSIDLLDSPDRRKIHSISTPSLGGVAIFSGFILATLISLPIIELIQLKFILGGAVVIFILGVRDDISSLRAHHKLFAQLFSASLVVILADIRLTGFYGILGIDQMPEWFNIPFSVFVIIALTNAFNLIDGIDGLAGSVGIFILTFFAWFFLMDGQLAFAILSLSLVGALIAFLYFNWYPSKIFMGDTGSMVLGFIVSALAIRFINHAHGAELLSFIEFNAPVAVCVALLILPVYDTIRVFAIRFIQGRNPLDPDRNHLHHGLLRLGMNHSQATVTLLSFNIFILVFALALNSYLQNGELLMVIMISSALICSVVDIMLYQKRFARKAVEVVPEKNLYFPKSA